MFDLRTTGLDEKKTRVHLSIDLLTLDFGSIQILLREWLQIYHDPAARLAPFHISFRDYVMAVELLRTTRTAGEAERYWRARVESLPPPPQLPFARAPASIDRPVFVRRSARLGVGCWRAIKKKLAASAAVTPSSVLLAAFSDVLAAWSKSRRFTINVTLFQRPALHPQLKDLVGDFTSINLLEADLGAAGSFESLARRIQRQVAEDLAHAEYGGVRVLQDMARARGSSFVSMPVVFSSALVLDTSQTDVMQAAIPSDLVYAVSQTPQVWLDHQVYEQGGRLHVSWDAVEELFPEGVLDDMFAAYVGLLEQLAEGTEAWKEKRRERLPEYQRALQAEANRTGEARPEGLLQTAFERQAREHPERVAVIGAGKELSYGELQGLAWGWARRLRQMGARPNGLVGVVMERGWEQVVAVLAIVEAGAAYLPVDPELPAERREHLLRRGEVEVVLTQSWVEERLEWPGGMERLCVDREEVSGEESAAGARPEDLAYVLFTSGSSGEPKGVMMEHRGALNTIEDLNQRWGVGPGDRILALSSLSFDLSVYDIFGALAAGAAVVLPDPRRQREPSHWMELMRRHRVSIWNSVPALMEMMAEYVEGRGESLPEALRLALWSGDWIGVGLPERVRLLAPGAELVSLGGATEAGIWSIYYRIGTVDASWKSIPYGRPLRNQRIYVLNEAMQACPVWVAGELYIGGSSVARGVLAGPGANGEAQFRLRHPVSGERLYRTSETRDAICRMERSNFWGGTTSR